RFSNFRIVVTDGGRTNDNVRITDVLSRMTFGNFYSQRLQAISNFRFLLIGTADSESEVSQHFGNARHAYAADADKMNVLEWSKHDCEKSAVRSQRNRVRDGSSPLEQSHLF